MLPHVMDPVGWIHVHGCFGAGQLEWSWYNEVIADINPVSAELIK